MNNTVIIKDLLKRGYTWQDVEYYIKHPQEYEQIIKEQKQKELKRLNKTIETNIYLYYNNIKHDFIISYDKIQQDDTYLFYQSNDLQDIYNTIKKNTYMIRG